MLKFSHPKPALPVTVGHEARLQKPDRLRRGGQAGQVRPLAADGGEARLRVTAAATVDVITEKSERDCESDNYLSRRNINTDPT